MHRPNCVDVIVFYGSYTNTEHHFSTTMNTT